MRKGFLLDSVLSQGVRVYDLLSIISLSAGINLLTGSEIWNSQVSMFRLLCVITCIILLIISGFAFSWLSYWVRRYVEEIAEHRIGEAAQKIRNAHKEWRFLLHALVGTVSLVLAGLMFVLGKMI